MKKAIYQRHQQEITDFYKKKFLNIMHDDVKTALLPINPVSLCYLSEELKDRNSSLILGLLKTNGLLLEYCTKKQRADYAFAKTALDNNGLALRFVSKELAQNHSIALAAVKQNADALAFVDYSLRNDKTIALTALKNNRYRAMGYLSFSMQQLLSANKNIDPIQYLEYLILKESLETSKKTDISKHKI